MVRAISVVDLRNSKNLNLIFTGIKQVQLARSKIVTTAWSRLRHSHEPTAVDLLWTYSEPTVALLWTYRYSSLCMDDIVLLLTLLGGCDL